MESQDPTTHTTPSGHESHNKIRDDDEEKTSSPKIDKKMSFSRSEDDVFADAVTEFAESGSAHKSFDRDVFFSFKDAENGGTNEVLNAPIVASEKTDPLVEKIEETEIKTVVDSSESNRELTGAGGLVKDGGVGPAPEPQEAKSIDVMETGEEKGQETPTFETITEEAKDSEVIKTTPEVSAVVGGHDDGISEGSKQEIKADFEHVSEVVKESETVEEIKIEKLEVDHETAPEVVKGSEIDNLGGVDEEIKEESLESDHKQVPEAYKASEVDQTVSVLDEKLDLDAANEQIQEVVNEPVPVLTEKEDLEAPELGKSSGEQIQEEAKEPASVLTEKEDLGVPHLEKQSVEYTHEVMQKPDSILTEKDLGTPELEGSSKEQIQEVVLEPVAVLTEKEDLGGARLEKRSTEYTHEVVEKPDDILTEKDLGMLELEGSSKEQIQEVVKKPDTILTEKDDLGGPHLEKQSNEPADEVVKKPDSVLTENVVEEPDSVLTQKEDLGAHKSEECSKDEVTEQKVNNDSNLVADVSTEMVTIKDSSDNSVTDSKNASGVVLEPNVEEGSGKLVNNQDSGADLTVDSSSVNSLEGTWGSVSVLSTASIDAETLQSTEKSKVNSGKSNAATSDVYEPPSFMTLVEPESKDTKSGSSEAQDSHPQPNPEASQAGWFPTLTKVSNESEGRKRNEEAMAKVTNWSTGKHSTPLKNLLGEARSPSGKQPEPVAQKDEAAVNALVNDDVASPPKLIEDGKDGRKKVKGRSSWAPFVCCSSVNVK